MTDPQGWTNTDIAMALRLGYSKAGVPNLRPTCRDWTLAQLVCHKATLTPYVLDPTVRMVEEMFT